MNKNDGYTPNHIPKGERIKNIIFSLALFAYGTYGVWVNDLYLPGKRTKGVHLHGIPAWIFYSAIISACLVMLSVVVDHYDKRNNEIDYRMFADFFKCFFIVFCWFIVLHHI